MRRRILLGLAIVLLAGLGIGWMLFGPATIVVDLATRHQTIDGWEATAELPENPTDPANAQGYDRLLDAAVDQVGINRLRLEVRAGAETGDAATREFFAGRMPYAAWEPLRYRAVNDNDDPQVIDPDGFDFTELDYHVETTLLPLRARLRARGEDLVVNLCYVGFVSGPYLHRDPEEYAEFVLAASLHLRQRWGVVPDLWEVVLEPDVMPDGWTGAEMGQAMVATAARLRAAGFTPAFAAPSVTDMANAVPYLEAIAAVPGATDALVEFSFHPYDNRSVRGLREIARTGRAMGLRTAMLEWWFGLGTPAVLLQDLVAGEVSAWQGRSLRGYLTPGGSDAGADFAPRAETRLNALLFANVRRGAVRVGAASRNPLVTPAAFVNPDGTATVVALTRRAGGLRVAGLPEGTYRVAHATEADVVEVAAGIEVAAGGTLAAAIPAAGMLLVTSRPDG